MTCCTRAVTSAVPAGHTRTALSACGRGARPARRAPARPRVQSAGVVDSEVATVSRSTPVPAPAPPPPAAELVPPAGAYAKARPERLTC